MIQGIGENDAVKASLVHENILDIGRLLLSPPYSHEVRSIREFKLVELRLFLKLPSINFVAIGDDDLALLSRDNLLDALSFGNAEELKLREREELLSIRTYSLIEAHLIRVIGVFDVKVLLFVGVGMVVFG